MSIFDFATDILIIGLVTVLIVQCIKAPVKTYLTRKGIIEGDHASRIFKIIATLVAYLCCFICAVIYFYLFKHTNPFVADGFINYVLLSVSASQAIYGFIETYGRDGIIQLIEHIIKCVKVTTDDK